MTDLLMVIERELGKPAPEGAAVSERELAILAEIRALKAEIRALKAKAGPAPRKAADNGKVAAVARDVVRAMLEGRPVRAVAAEFGISDAQCRRVFFQHVLYACRREIGRLQPLVEAPGGEAYLVVLTRLRFLERAQEGNILKKAQDEYSLVSDALASYWQAADELQAFTAESLS